MFLVITIWYASELKMQFLLPSHLLLCTVGTNYPYQLIRWRCWQSLSMKEVVSISIILVLMLIFPRKLSILICCDCVDGSLATQRRGRGGRGRGRSRATSGMVSGWVLLPISFDELSILISLWCTVLQRKLVNYVGILRDRCI